MDKVTKFVECLVPISHCNLKCSYCYVIQENRRGTTELPFRCSPEKIGKAFSPMRWGGLMMVNLCGYGETLMPNEMPDIIYNILLQGHYVNVTNNGTMSKRFDEIVEFPKELLSRLCFAFSLHYIELKKTNMLQTFVNNVNKIRKSGCSYLIQLNLADEYIEVLDEIKSFCSQEFGFLPQVALTRKEDNNYSIYSALPEEQYVAIGRGFNSPLFDFTYKNFRVKRKEFCYAGEWSFKLDLATGDLKSCYFSRPHYNIYDNINEKIKTSIIGSNCRCDYCINSSHFLSLGVIPEIDCPTYVYLRDPNNVTYTDCMRAFLDQKLYDNNSKW